MFGKANTTALQVENNLSSGPHVQAINSRRFASNKSTNLLPFVWATLGAAVTYGIPLVFGNQHGDPTISIMASVLVVMFSVVFFSFHLKLFVLFWISLVMLQNVAAGFWHVGHSGNVPLMVTEAKSVSLMVGVLLCLPKIISILKRHPALGIGFGIYVFAVLSNIGSLDPAALANLRNFLTPFALILLAMSLSEYLDVASVRRTILGAMGIAAFWMTLGTIGELLVGTNTWRQVFSAESLGSLNSLSQTTNFFGITLARVGGVLLEPSNTGYVAASVIIVLLVQIYFSSNRTINLGHLALLASAVLVLTYASVKNSNLMIIVAILCIIFMVHFSIRPWLSLILSWISAFAITMTYIVLNIGPGYFLTVWSDPLGSVGGDSSSVHMAGLISGFSQLADDPFGHGLGSGGNMRAIMDPELTWTEWLSTGSESSWGTLAYQLGVFGVVGFVLTLFVLANIMGRPSAVLLAVWSSAALFVEAFFGPISGSLLLLAAGSMTEGGRDFHTPDKPSSDMAQSRLEIGGPSPGSTSVTLSRGQSPRHPTGWV